MPTRRVLLPSLSVALGLVLGCNSFIQNPGPYELRATEVMRDECALLPEGEDLGKGSLLITGQVIRMDFERLDMQLVGRFLAGGERFALDGSVSNTAAVVRGQECRLDQVSVHLEGATVCETQFNGTLRVKYEARSSDSCVCELWAKFEAVQDSASCSLNP